MNRSDAPGSAAPLPAGPVALVTGAAGGIGAEVAAALAARDDVVAAVDLDGEGLAKLRASAAPLRTYTCDVTSAAEVDRLVAAVERELGPVRHLVNAAGVLRTGEATDLTDDDFEDAFAVNAFGVIRVCRAVVRRMRGRRRGAVVTVASNAAAVPRTGMAAYGASKAAAAMYTKCLGLEVARYGVRCNVVAPGSTDTPMLAPLLRDGGERAYVDGIPSEYRTGIPLGRLGRPADVAAAVAFLLSEQAAHITLHTLTVDGGAALGA
ncbi:2,3-dihydro-2,3-dihydroxybenzoate dehydrogenase [Streptomyces boninensis]|uniref:2,3-dihydro-2,3-dihydroxybenzoate dehydrogenase n=1 Tax=Streptomyces boninensis TaxID=2039455 RepID=UPI003B228E94